MEKEGKKEKENIKLYPPVGVMKLLRLFFENGITAYIVGGAVRDSLRGEQPHDWDIASPATPEATSRLCSDFGYRVIPTGQKHGTVTVLIDGEPIEVTSFRIDGSYADGRHPDSVIFTDRITDDLARRDFTVNAMAYSPEAGICDPYNGQADMKDKIIRCVGDARVRFTEDALRILRAFRFAARLDYDIDFETLSAAKALASRLSLISAERISSELLLLLSAPKSAKYLKMMKDCGVLEYVLPGCSFSDRDIYAVDRIESSEQRLGTLLRSQAGENGEKVSAVLSSLRFPTVFCKRVYSMATSALPAPELASVRRFVRETTAAKSVAAAAAARNEENADKILMLIDEVAKEGGPPTMKSLKINGKQLGALGITDGRMIGRILNILLLSVTVDPSMNTPDKLQEAAKKLFDELKLLKGESNNE